MRVLLARHGETDWNAKGRIQGSSDTVLNSRGREQAVAMARRLLGMGARGPSKIYASPLRRAMETAEIVGRELGITPVIAPELTELSFGDWEGCSWEEIGRRWPGQFKSYSADRRNYAPPNGESYAQMLARAWPFVDALRKTCGTVVLCVCHSAVMRGILAQEAGLTVSESYKKIKLPNGSIAELDSLV